MARWQHYFAAAWQEIKRGFPGYAPAIGAGLTVLMPMSPVLPGRAVSAARHAFGAIGMALPADPATLAQLLVLQFQRVKLHAVLDLFDLYDSADPELYPVPWEEAPRPLGGLRHEAYARLAVQPGSARTREAIRTLAAAGSLTPLGARFVGEMRQSAPPSR